MSVDIHYRFEIQVTLVIGLIAVAHRLGLSEVHVVVHDIRLVI